MSNRKVIHHLGLTALTLVLNQSVSLLSFANDDPWEDANRAVFGFNESMDNYLIKPVAKIYDALVPPLVKRGVHNFFDNVGDVNTLINNVLQLKLGEAAVDSGRFLINTTMGIGGILDLATPMGLQKNDEDFGQTLGHWGVGSGPYIMLPFFGPSNLRDSISSPLDYYFDPVMHIEDGMSRGSVLAVDLINKRAAFLGVEDIITWDRYTFLRDAYIQRREYKVYDGEVADEFDDY